MIMFCGDSHCDFMFLHSKLEYAKQHMIENIIVCGDFGYWPDDPQGFCFLSYLNTFMKEKFTRQKLYWVDGNHEDFNSIKKLPQNEISEIPEVERCFYIPRGCVVEIDSRKIMGFGGAVSIDKQYRVVNESWFIEESITDEQINKLKHDKVDILVTHDSPLNILREDYKNDTESTINREKIKKICDIVNPNILIHGHYHKFEKYSYRDIDCIALAHNYRPQESFIIL